MDYDKKTFDELFNYGNKILDKMQDAAAEKSAALESSKDRYKNLREDLQALLNRNVEEEKF